MMLALVRGSEKSSKDLKEAAAAVCLLQQVAIEEHPLVMRNRAIEEHLGLLVLKKMKDNIKNQLESPPSRLICHYGGDF